MNHAAKAAAPLLATVLLLSGCGGSAPEPPRTYDLVENALPALSELIPLDDGFTFEESTDEESGAVTYIYDHLSSGGETVEAYVQALENEYDCTVWTDQSTGEADFSTDTGEAKAAQPLEDPEEVFLLTITWDESACTVTPSLAQADILPQPEVEPVTLEEAVSYVQSLSPSYLGLSGASMDEYLIYPQDGAAFLDDQPCLCLNVYLAANHQHEGSYLLTLPDRQLYALDRETGQATPLD